MAQWIIVNRNSSFVNPPRLSILCEISGPVRLAEPGLTAGWLAGGRIARKFQKVWNSLQIEIIEFSLHLTKVPH